MAYSKQNFQNGQILNAANLEAMENGIIASQGAENLLDNGNFRDPVNSRGKNTYSNEGNEYTIDRWETQGGTNISIENGYINIFGQWELYQRIQNPKDGIYTFAARIRINSVGQFTPSIEVNNGSNTGRRINLDANIGEWKTYILQYDLSSMTAETIRFLLSPRGGDTTASISVEWAAMYKGAYTAATLPAYQPKGKHVEMLNCGVPLTPLNLLDNSDFRNPVNSRGITSTEAAGYHVDRWKKENASGKVTVGNGYLSMTGTGAYWFLTQHIEPKKIKSGAVYTVALADTSGSVSVCSTVMSTDMAKFTARHTFTSRAVVMTNVEYTSDKYSVYFTSNSSAETRFAWAALYEGSYDASTLPPYIPKGKHVEMLNCNVPLAPRNLLDNSDFRNPVNHQGASEYSGYLAYTIDRWFISTSDTSVTVQSGSIKATTTSGNSYANISQKIASATRYAGKTLTLAAYVQSNVTPRIIAYKGGTSIASKEGTSGSYQLLICNFTVPADITDGALSIRIQSKSTQAGDYVEVQWAALYEGAYTADTLPNYVPKDKHVEMLNCGVPIPPKNILKNSDFTHPLNTKGFSSISSGAYTTTDCWKSWISGNGGKIELTSSGIKLSPPSSENIGIYQQIENYQLNKIYTIVVYINDLPYLKSFQMGNFGVGTKLGSVYFYSIPSANVLIRINSTDSAVTIQKVALYEGAYTVDTLPGYISNTKHVEMLNCNVPLAPHNLLDNSDFRNPVNQRRESTYSGAVYGIDRWKGYSTQQTVYVRSIDTTVSATGTSYIGITQKVANMSKLAGKTITFAAKVWSSVVPCIRFTDAERISLKNVDGTAQADQILVLTYTVPSDATSDNVIPTILCRSTASGDYIRIHWAALYEGAYDASTLPPYQPKGYAAELNECMRYYYQSNDNKYGQDGMIIRRAINIEGSTNSYSLESVDLPVPMRITPTITLYDDYGNANCVVEWYSNTKIWNPGIRYANNRSFCVSEEGGAFVGGKSYFFNYTASADL